MTGKASLAAGWLDILPSYIPGQMVAINIYLNNAGSKNDNDNIIVALINPVNAVFRGLRRSGSRLQISGCSTRFGGFLTV
jgi:hypothetical protein